MQTSKSPIILAVTIIAVGTGWLMTALDYAPGINWVWTLCLAAIGLLTFVGSGGLDKVSLVVGPFFLAASLLSILRQQKLLAAEVELPILVIVLGVLLLVAQLPVVPLPKWYGPEAKPEDRKKGKA